MRKFQDVNNEVLIAAVCGAMNRLDEANNQVAIKRKQAELDELKSELILRLDPDYHLVKADWEFLRNDPGKSVKYKELLKRTELVDEHPEWYEDECWCRLCQSYAI